MNKEIGKNEVSKRKIYEITRCSNNACSITYERDKNASVNIRKLLIHKLKKQDRPDYLKKQKANQPLPTILAKMVITLKKGIYDTQFDRKTFIRSDSLIIGLQHDQML